MLRPEEKYCKKRDFVFVAAIAKTKNVYLESFHLFFKISDNPLFLRARGFCLKMFEVMLWALRFF